MKSTVNHGGWAITVKDSCAASGCGYRGIIKKECQGLEGQTKKGSLTDMTMLIILYYIGPVYLITQCCRSTKISKMSHKTISGFSINATI